VANLIQKNALLNLKMNRNDDLVALYEWEYLDSLFLSHYFNGMTSSDVGKFIGLRNFY
jgi:hypothetical protein